MKLTLIFIISLTISIKCIESETVKRVLINNGNNNNNDINNGSLLDVKISAEYGVQNTENDKAKVIQIFPENHINTYNQTVLKPNQQNDLQSMETGTRNQIISPKIQDHNQPQEPQNRISGNPSLKEIQNVLNQVESNNNEQPKPSKIFQVLRVPAIYELHMQAENQNFNAQNLLSKLIMTPRLKLSEVQQQQQQQPLQTYQKLSQTYQQSPQLFQQGPQTFPQTPQTFQQTPQTFHQPDLMIDQNQYNQQQNMGGLWQQPVNDMSWAQLPGNEASYNSLATQNIPGVLYLNVPQASFHYMSPGVMDNTQHVNNFGYNQMNYPQMMYAASEINYPDYMSAESTNFGSQTFDQPAQEFVQNSRKFIVPTMSVSNNHQNQLINNQKIGMWNSEDQILEKPQAIHEVPAPNLNKTPKSAVYTNRIVHQAKLSLSPPPLPAPPTTIAATTRLQKLPNVIYGQPPSTTPTISTVEAFNSYHQPSVQTMSYLRSPLDNFKIKPLTSSYKIAPTNTHQSLNIQKNKSVIVPKSNFLANNQQQLNNFYTNGLNDAFSLPTQHLVFIQKPIQDQYNSNQHQQTFTTTTTNFAVNKALEGYLDRQLMEPSTQNYEEEIMTRPTESTILESKTQINDNSNNQQEVVTNVPHYQVSNQDQNLVPNINLFLLKNVDSFENQIQPNLVPKDSNQNSELKFESLKLSSVTNDNKVEYTGKPMVFDNIENNNKKYYENQPRFVPNRNIIYPRPFGSSNRRSFNRYRGGGGGPSGGYVILIKERTFD